MGYIFLFLIIAVGVAFGLHYSVPDDHYRICIYAGLIFLLCLSFSCTRPLPGDAVDLIYYASAIIAAVLIFISHETERRSADIEKHASRFTANGQLLAANSLRLRMAVADDRSLLDATRVEIVGVSADLGLPAVTALVRSEQQISSAILASAAFSRFIADLHARKGSCDELVPALIEDNARIFAQQHRIEPPRGDRTDGFDDRFRQAMEEGRFRSNLLIIDECNAIGTASKNAERGEPSFDKVLHLHSDMLRPALNAAGQPMALDEAILIDGKSENVADVIGRIASVRRHTTRLAALQLKATRLDHSIPRDTRRAQRSRTLSWLAGRKARDFRSEAREARDQPASSLASWSSEMVLFRWPYVLIAFLALKIATKSYVPKRLRASATSSRPS